MQITAIAIGLFAVTFLLHLFIWRIRLPRRQTAALLAIFMFTLAAGLLANAILPAHPVHFWPAMQISIFHVAMTLAYVVAYSAIEERSPSMTLVTFVAHGGAEGRSHEEMLVVLQGFEPLDRRLAAMVRDAMITDEGDRYALTAKGRQWAGVLSFWRRLLGRGKGG